jgi:hypothetical protein
MRYITKPTVLLPAQGVQKENTGKYIQSYGAKNRAPLNTNRLQTNTHTKNGVFPPIVVRISKSHLFRFQPKEGMKLHFFNESKVSGSRILKYPTVPFLLKNPNSNKPNNSEK